MSIRTWLSDFLDVRNVKAEYEFLAQTVKGARFVGVRFDTNKPHYIGPSGVMNDTGPRVEWRRDFCEPAMTPAGTTTWLNRSRWM